jgi:hypothetical protein
LDFFSGPIAQVDLFRLKISASSRRLASQKPSRGFATPLTFITQRKHSRSPRCLPESIHIPGLDEQVAQMARA